MLDALGAVGNGADPGRLLERALLTPTVGDVVLSALVHLKRRGFSVSEDEAYSVLGLYFEEPRLSPAQAAEVLSSRADAVVTALEREFAGDPDWERAVALLEALDTRAAIARLVSILDSERERAGWYAAALALGRLEIAEAETALLARRGEEPEACLFALSRVGREATVRALLDDLTSEEPRPGWSREEACRVLLQLGPSPAVQAAAQRAGALRALRERAEL